MNTIKLNTTGERPIKKGGGGSSRYTYYNVEGLGGIETALVNATLVRGIGDDGSLFIVHMGEITQWNGNWASSVTAIAVDLEAKVYFEGEFHKTGDLLKYYHPDLKEITEKEFYALPQPKNHSISGEIYVSYNECTFGYNMYTGGFNMPKGSTLVVNGNEVEETNYNQYRYNVYEADGWYPFELKFTQAVTNLDCFGMGDSFNGGVTILRNLDFSNFDASAVTSISQEAFSFGGDVLPQTLDLSMCNFENVEHISAFSATSYEKESSFTLKLDGYMPKLLTWYSSYLEGVTATLMYKKENEQYITPYKDILTSSGWTLVPY